MMNRLAMTQIPVNQNYDLRGDLNFLKNLYAQSPLSIWASLGRGDNYRIVYWNDGAEHIYGVKANDAIGRNYLDLFVAEEDPQVRRDSENDCDDIINHGKQFINYLAVDRKQVDGKKSGQQILLLTNVFRVTIDGQGYQVEMAVDVTSSGLLEFRRPEFRQLKQVVDQIKREVQLTTYENINKIINIDELERLILQTLLDLTEAQGIVFALPTTNSGEGKSLYVKRYQGFSLSDVKKLESSIRENPLWEAWNKGIPIERNMPDGAYYAIPIPFSDRIFGAVGIFHPMPDFFDTRRKEAVKSFVSRVSGLYEVSTRFDFNRNWRVSLAHELLSQAGKIRQSLAAYVEEHPEATNDNHLAFAIHTNQIQLDLASNIINVNKEDSFEPATIPNIKSFRNVVQCVEVAIASQAPSIKLKQQVVELEVPDSDVARFQNIDLLGDASSIERILRVLFHNATKYGKIGSAIRVRIHQTNEHLSIEICNTGHIQQEVLDNAFESEPLLIQGANKDGAHVGLHVSRKIARAIKGDITLRNSSDNLLVVATLVWPIRQ